MLDFVWSVEAVECTGRGMNDGDESAPDHLSNDGGSTVESTCKAMTMRESSRYIGLVVGVWVVLGQIESVMVYVVVVVVVVVSRIVPTQHLYIHQSTAINTRHSTPSQGILTKCSQLPVDMPLRNMHPTL